MEEKVPVKVEYCDGLCINPESIKTDALRLMAYSNSIQLLRKRGADCPVTDANLDRNIFTEVLSLVVTLSLRCRLWNDNYRRTLDLKDVENSVVGVRRNGTKAGKKIKLREVTSFIAHSSGFWFDPYELKDASSGINFSISVPYDSQRVNKINSSIDLILEELSKVNNGQQVDTTVADVLRAMKNDDIDTSSEPDRVYTINLDDFACAVCSVVDHCHSCAGVAGFLILGKDGFPDRKTLSLTNLSGWVVQIKETKNTGEIDYEFMGVEGRSKELAVENSRNAIRYWSGGTPTDSTFQIEFIAEYYSDSTQLHWTAIEQ